MAHGLNSTKTPARPSHEALEPKANATDIGMTEQQKIDKVAMQGAKRAENRLISNEETTRSNSIFSK